MRSFHVRVLLLALPAVLGGVLGLTSAAVAACPNEAIRAEQGDQHLPDCRAYELVTPSDKAPTTPLMGPHVLINFAIADDGSRLWIRGPPYLGENPNSEGTNAVLSRASSGWTMTSLKPPGSGDTSYEPTIFNPDLTMAGAETLARTHLLDNSLERSFVVGPPGGPYTTIASTFDEEDSEQGAFGNGHYDYLGGAAEDGSRVVLASSDHTLAPGATETVAGAHDLYEWSQASGGLKLVNVTSGGALVNTCGAVLGTGFSPEAGRNPVSSDGSKMFFVAPDPTMRQSSEPSCKEPERLYMRVDGRETVEISAPLPGVSDPTGLHSAYFRGATLDGVHVWFVTETELTPDDIGHESQLYEYNTLTHDLVRVSRGESGTEAGEVRLGIAEMAFSEDGSVVYFAAPGKLTANTPSSALGAENVYRYDTATGATHYIATATAYPSALTMNASADGEALVFEAKETSDAEGLLYGGIQDELFRYDAPDETVICVSCAPGVEGATGSSTLLDAGFGHSHFLDGLAEYQVADEGRYVFFTSGAALVPQDTTEGPGENIDEPQDDVYEWESRGSGSCLKVEGCLSLISTPGSFGSIFLGTGADGRDLFFTTYAALVPQDHDLVADIYDARIDGGFAAPSATPCSGEGCRLIASAAPVFGTPQSAAFNGAGNPTAVSPVNAKAKGKKIVIKAKGKRSRTRRRKRKVGQRANGAGGRRRGNSLGAVKANGRDR